MRKYILNIILIHLLIPSLFAIGDVQDNGRLLPGNCNGYEVLGMTAVFSCENNIRVLISQMDDGIFRIWYNRDTEYKPVSGAVVMDEETGGQINIRETGDGYEIYSDRLIIRISKAPFRIRIFDKWQKLLMEDYQSAGFAQYSSGAVGKYMSMSPGERIYGLGEKNGNIDRSGGRYTMWNSDRPCYSPIEDPLYKSIPFFISSKGYALFVDNTYKSVFDFSGGNGTYYSIKAGGGEMVCYFIYGPSIKEILTGYTRLTGKAIMPPAWALGFSQSRGLLTNEDLTREIAQSYRSKQIPCDIIYQDIGWTQNLQDFEWKKENYNDPLGMLSDLADQGFKVIVSQDPVISKNNTSQWTEADTMGYFALDIRSGKSYDMPWPWGGNCGLVDFTNPEVADWWGDWQQKVVNDGVKGFWTDMGEPAWSNEEDRDRLFIKHFAGMHDEVHNIYGFHWDRIVTRQFEKHNPGIRIFQMTRSAFAGMQRYTFGWSGDAGNGSNVSNGWEQLKAQVPLAMSAGLGLIPFWSCDISGYCGDIEDYEDFSELYTRWLQFGAFNPLSRIHHEGNNAVEPWLFTDETTSICRSAIELKYRLFPYIYTYAREAYDKGWPLIRPLLMEYENDSEVFDLNSEFLFGDKLLVAPVTEEGQATKKIYLPEGEWIDFFNREMSWQGKKWIEYAVELEHIPVFVKSGSVIPMMPVMQYINEIPGYNIELNIFPAGVNKKAEFKLYEDDGETNDYRRDRYVRRNIVCRTIRKGYIIDYKEKSNNGYIPEKRDLVYNVYLDARPSSVKAGEKKIKYDRSDETLAVKAGDIKKAKWRWDREKGICTIFVPYSESGREIIISKGE